MSAQPMLSIPPGAAGLGASSPPARSALGQLWQTRAPRERQLVVAMAVLILITIVWLVAIQPALSTLRRAPGELDALDLRLQQTQLAALEARTLRATTPVPQAQAAQALRAATDRLGDKARLTLQGDRATVNFNGIGMDGLRSWLLEARSGARARPVEAQLLKSGSGYTGSISVVLSGAA